MDNNIDVPVKMETTAMIDNKDLEEKQATEVPVKKSVKEEKSRKKDDKSVEQVLKALNSLETTEEKLAAMCKKYSDIVDENRKLQLTVKQTEKRLGMVQREKEQLQTEHSKAVLTRSRLESLCRELQRQNKAIKDESLLKIREEEEKRKEVSAKFQSTLNEITTLMQQNNEKNAKLREDNLEMTKKFKTVCEQYELREQQVEKITKQMQLEAQLADAKLAKAKMEMAAEKEMLLKEKQQLLMDLTEYQAKCQELQTTEMNLRGQISLYTDKYDEFQNALSRSNEVFGGFKGEMEKMSKKICKLEKETSSWKQRWEKSHQALLEMAADKQQRDSELALATRQLAQLQKLCRTLQAERTSLLAQLRTEGASKTVPVPVPTGKVESSIEPLQLDQDQSCIHEPQKDSTEIEECNVHTSTQSQNIAADPLTLTQNTENILIDAITSIDISQNPVSTDEGTVPNVTEEVLENTNGLLIEQDLPSMTLIEQTVHETSPVNSSEQSVGLLGMQGEANDTVPHLQNEILSIEPANEKSSVNDSTSVNIALSNKETSSDSLVNSQVPDPSEVKNNLIEELTNNHFAENGTEEQIPIKASTEIKKGKEGGKKRKNK